MYRMRKVNLLAVSIVVASLVLGTAGAALAQAPAPDPASGAAPCYAAMRQDLGAVVPRGWRGYADAAACSQAARDLAAAAPQPIANVAAKVDLSACYRALREDLDTVWPDRQSSFLAAACANRNR